MQLRTKFLMAANREAPTDGIEAGYARWRRETRAVAECYRSWLAAPRAERFLAYAAYEAALEREERAASVYQELVVRSAGPGSGHAS